MIPAPRTTIAGEPVTHFVDLDGRRTRGRSYAVCGELVDLRDQSEHPSCAECLAVIDTGKSAEELFGTTKEIRSFGPPVATTLADSLKDYRPRAAKRG